MARIAYQSDLDKVVLSTRRRLARLVQDLRDDHDFQAFGERMSILLDDRHSRAAALGRQRAGDLGPREADDDGFAERVMDEESTFIRGFVADLESGKYTDPRSRLVDWRRIQMRAVSYAEKLSATAQEAWTLAGEAEARYLWKLGLRENHCPRCPEIAAGGPYTADSLPAHPRDGSLPCRQNCGCYVVRTDGRIGFMPTVSK